MISHNENPIKLLRLKANLTVEEVAKKLGVKPQTIYKYEEGTSRPRLTTAFRLCEIYNCTLDEIYKGVK